MRLRCDHLVIGSGVAGLSFALEAASRNDVLVVTKRAPEESATAYAQGGPLSNHILQKTVTLGVSTRNAGFVDNLIQFDTTFNVDPDTPYFYHQFRR